MMKYKTIITTKTIIAQIDKLIKNCFNFELVLKKAGSTNIRTAIKKIAGMICSDPMYYFYIILIFFSSSKNSLLFERIV